MSTSDYVKGRGGGEMTSRSFTRRCDDGEDVVVVFYDRGVQVGLACASDYNGKQKSFLHDLYVREDFRRQGYGTIIIQHMIKYYGVDTLYSEGSNAAIKLYNRFGFKEIDRFGKNMIVMQR